MAPLGGGVFVVLVERDGTVLTTLDEVRLLIEQDSADLGVSTIVRRPPRLWIEHLPSTSRAAVHLLQRLAR